MLDKITPVVLTYNEAPNIARLLERVRWAREVVVVDSLSSDDTVGLARGFPNVRVIVRKFEGHASQWNFAVHETAVSTEWVLAMDSDYILTEEFIDELSRLEPAAGVSGYLASFTYCVLGKPLRGSLYPPVTVLFRKALGRYAQDGHTQRLEVPGAVERLGSPILHDDRKPLARWLASQARYMELEAQKLESTPWGSLRWPDRVRRFCFIAPILVPLYCLFWRGLLLDGYAGLYYTMQRSIAEIILSTLLIERRLPAHGSARSDPSSRN